MTILRHEIPLTITLETPFCLPGSDVGPPGLDVTLARDTKGRCILPGTHLKGVLRGACRNIASAAPDATFNGRSVETLLPLIFGPESKNAVDGIDGHRFITERGLVAFGDLVATTCEPASSTPCVRVEIENDTGTAKDGHLQFIEAPWGTGAHVTFEGALIAQNSDGSFAKAVCALFDLALSQVVAFGGAKSAGFGFKTAHVIEQAKAVSAAEAKLPRTRRIQLNYAIDRPFLVDAQSVGSNLSIGAEVIPGSAIKAVLAKTMHEAGWDNGDLLSAMTIGHARPEGRTRVLPQTLFITPSGEFGCAFRSGEIPAGARFASDWKAKDHVHAEARFFPDAKTVRRRANTRTAVDGDTGIAQFDPETGGALFSQVVVDPGDMAWQGEIVLPDDDDVARRLLGVLEAGCVGLGKTKAVLSGTVSKACPPSVVEQDGPWIITLQTPCVMVSQGLMKGGASRADVEAAYQAYFSSLGFNLKRHAASQILRGGFQALAFKQCDDRYLPWLLTAAGSAFELEPNDSKSAVELSGYLETGLPPAGGYSECWQKMPFLPQQGFGAIRLESALIGLPVSGEVT